MENNQKQKPAEQASTNNQPSQPKKTRGAGFWVIIGLVVLFILFLLIGGCVGVGYYVYKNVEVAEHEAEDIVSEIEDYDYNKNTNSSDIINLENVNIGADSTSLEVYDEEVTVGDAKYKLTKVESLGNTLKGADSIFPDFMADTNANEGNVFLRVTFNVTNTGSVDLPGYALGSLNLYDGNDKYIVEPDSNANSWITEGEEYFRLDNVSAGKTEIVTHIYQVPENRSGWKLKVWDMDYTLPDEEAFLDLGL